MSKNYFNSPFLHERVFADILSWSYNSLSVQELLANRILCRGCIIGYWQRIGAIGLETAFHLNIQQVFWNYEREKRALAEAYARMEHEGYAAMEHEAKRREEIELDLYGPPEERMIG